MMDYHSLHGQDISNFSPAPSNTHRLPTVSAAQALESLQDSSSRCISTGLKDLDCALQNRNVNSVDDETRFGGVSRGQLTEVYGPPGVGKTMLGIQLTANVLRSGYNVVWVDASHTLPGPRLTKVISSFNKTQSSDSSPNTAHDAEPDLLSRLTHFTTPTLPHLIALLCHTTPQFPSMNTRLIVIDSLSTLIATTYPRTMDNGLTPHKPGAATTQNPQHWAASRKWSVLQYIISSLQKLAAVHDIAIVILNQSVTRMQSGSNAMLVPAIYSTAWEAGIATRIALFRNWGWEGKEITFAMVLKAEGIIFGGEDTSKVVAFTILDSGLEFAKSPIEYEASQTSLIATPVNKRKRKVDEIRDSEDEDDMEESDEDYGWAADDDDRLPAPPPQWQGSEDILVPGIEDGEEEPEDEEPDEEDYHGEVPDL